MNEDKDIYFIPGQIGIHYLPNVEKTKIPEVPNFQQFEKEFHAMDLSNLSQQKFQKDLDNNSPRWAKDSTQK